jgi:hypothetical protein
VGVFLELRRKWLGPLFPENEMDSNIHRLPKMVSAAYPTSSRLSSSSPPHRLQSSDRCVDDRALVLLHARLRELSGLKVIFLVSPLNLFVGFSSIVQPESRGEEVTNLQYLY